MTKGEKICKLIAKQFKGECGAFGGEDPDVNGNELTLWSQEGYEVYTFNDDGSVDIALPDCEEDYSEYMDTHYEKVEDLKYVFSWFMYIDDDDPQIFNKIDKIVNE